VQKALSTNSWEDKPAQQFRNKLECYYRALPKLLGFAQILSFKGLIGAAVTDFRLETYLVLTFNKHEIGAFDF
jgi:hypothetical protein